MSALLTKQLIAKYKMILGIHGPDPKIEIKNNLGSKWLGATNYSIVSKNGYDVENLSICLQRSILDHPETLERVLAHEMIHYQEFLNITQRERALIKQGLKPTEHGKSFHDGMNKINAVMGENFVTVKSDQQYKETKNTREFYVLVDFLYRGSETLGYQWAAKLSPQAVEHIRKYRISGSGGVSPRLFKTTDTSFAVGTGKIKRFGGFNVPRDDKAKALRNLYDAGNNIIETV